MSAIRKILSPLTARTCLASPIRRAGANRSFHIYSKPSAEKGRTEPQYRFKFLKGAPTVGIVGCPFSGGQGRTGVDLAPNKLISAGLVDQLSALGWEVHYNSQQKYIDIPYNPIPASSPAAPSEGTETFNGGSTSGSGSADKKIQRLPDEDIGKMKKPRLVSAVNQKVAQEVEEIAQKGWLPLTLGGDHSLAMGTVSGTKAKYPDACLIWVDAHADINTPLSTDSGNLHGCPVSFLLGLEGTDVSPFSEWLKPCLKPEEIVYIGLRDVDGPEKEILKKHGIKAFSMHHVDKYGIGKVVEMALDHVNPDRSKPIHLSYDVDALDPIVAPSTGTPVRGGLTFREGHYITEALAETGCLVSVDIMEVNPALLDPSSVEKTVAAGCSLARASLGETLL
ncbi:arginase [Kwoniella dejecticola CBS 10117]|uniref:Arginase n=1 Tax=Kwoniella dejecticola CBS 10117 TaxID=1296121 RepID=A0A1A6A1H2_9TREE|nr:arginase [Kwoniella dejecticola CBS 10117]OBR83907.1 arginase [Kwoniella dejecticola CBS 10117]